MVRVRVVDWYNDSCFLKFLCNKNGAGEGSRNPISSLENLHTNRCTTPAALIIMGWDTGIEPVTFWTTIRRSNHLS